MIYQLLTPNHVPTQRPKPHKIHLVYLEHTRDYSSLALPALIRLEEPSWMDAFRLELWRMRHTTQKMKVAG